MADKTVRINFEAVSNFGNVINNVKQIQTALRGIKLPDKIGNRLEKNLTGVVASMEKLQMQSKKGFTKPGDVAAYEKELLKADTMLNKIVKDIGSLSGKDLLKLNIDTTKITQLKQQLKDVKKEMTSNVKGAMLDPSIGLKGSVSGMDQLINKGTKTRVIYDQLIASINKGNFSKAESEWTNLISYMEKYNSKKLDDTRWTTFKEKMIAALDAGENAVKEMLPEIERLDAAIQDGLTIEEGNVVSTLDKAKTGASQTADQFGKLADRERDAADGMLTMNQQMSQLKTQANYFFSLQNMFQLLKRGIQDAFQTVKDLDKAMTETAVVTDFSVKDMWSALPEYTKLANKLGATTQGAYETMTLYYQQGLNKEQAFGLGEETMKMARIAGLDYAETTNMMTAALRGFNMELDNASAKRINDVYSNLAAKTASDTYELGSAMERTASIAHSANMSFESTTAFLANMIETTREAPENLGTAMKTIVARFQELKENPYGMSEVEGEEVNFNRVDKALKTIGVDLVDNKDKFRDLDDVFMDISQKWDGLSQTQQRYIATIAAGSRQQSRFIAMVGNYKRISELTEAANNSAGASNIQFAKTLDSVEAKLNKLKNAWDWFLMGITNSDFLKTAVDFGTGFLTILNKIIDTVSGLTGPLKGVTKSILSLGAAFVGLKVGGKIVNAALGGVGNLIDPKGKGEGFLSGLTGRRQAASSANAKEISTPIVGAVNRLIQVCAAGFKQEVAAEKNSNTSTELHRASVDEFAQVRQNFYKSSRNGFTASSLINQLNKVDASQQKTLMGSTVGLTSNIRQSFMNQFSRLDLTKEGKVAIRSFWNGMMQDVKSGAATWAEALEVAFNPMAVGEKIGGKTGEAVAAAMPKKTITKDVVGPLLENANASPRARRWTSKRVTEQVPDTSLNTSIKKINLLEGGATKIASGFGAAGQAVMSFGMIVDSVIPGAGTAFTSLGMAINGIGTIIGTVGNKIKDIGRFLVAHPILLAITAITAAIAIAVKAYNKHIKNIRKDAKEVTKSFQTIQDETNKNLTKLEEYKSTFSKLSEGVDENGYNISLGAEEYADYKNTVNELIKMNPALIKGYNAEGQAIIDNNKALAETIKLQKQKQKEASKEYTKEESLQKLVNARDTYDRFTRNTQKTQQGVQQTYNKGEQRTYDGPLLNDRDQYAKDYLEAVKKYATKYGVEDKINDILDSFQVPADNYIEAARVFAEQGSNIQAAISSEFKMYASSISSEELTEISDSMATFGKEQKKFEESYNDVYENLSAWATDQKLFGDLEGEWQTQAMNGLKQIASNPDYTGVNAARDMHEAAYEMNRKFSEAMSGEYEDIIKSVDKAQDAYLKSGEKSVYLDSVADEIEDLEALFTKENNLWLEHGDDSARVIADMYRNKITEIQKFTQEGAKALEDQFNTWSDKIDAANGAFENYQKATEGGDFYTGVENFAQIAEDAFSDKNMAGHGSMAMETGAIDMFGEENVRKWSEKTLRNNIKEVKGMLKEGEEGVANFMRKIDKEKDNQLPIKLFGSKNGKPKTLNDYMTVTDEGINFHDMEDLDTTQINAMAEALGVSDELFAALLNKARQFGDIDFTSETGIREALMTGGQGIVSETSTTKDKETGEVYNNVYTRRSTFEAEARAQGVKLKDLKKLEDKLSKKGVKLLPDSDVFGEKTMKRVIDAAGIGTEEGGKTTTQNAVSSLVGLGYSKEEVTDILSKAGVKDLLSDKADVSKIYDEVQDALENPELAAIEENGATLNELVRSIADGMGILTTEDTEKDEQLDKGASAKTVVDLADSKGNKLVDDIDWSRWGAEKKDLQARKDEIDARIEDLQNKADNATTQQQKEEIEAEIALLDDASDRLNKAITNGQKIRDQIKKESKIQDGETAAEAGKRIMGKGGIGEGADSEQRYQLAKNFIKENAGQDGVFGALQDKDGFNLSKTQYQELVNYFRNNPLILKVNTVTDEKGIKRLASQYGISLKNGTKQKKFVNVVIQATKEGKSGFTAGVDKLLSQFGGKDEVNKKFIIDYVAASANGDKKGAESALESMTGLTKNEKGNLQEDVDFLLSGNFGELSDINDELQKIIDNNEIDITLNYNESNKPDTGSNKDSNSNSSLPATPYSGSSGAAPQLATQTGSIKYTEKTLTKNAEPGEQEGSIKYTSKKLTKDAKPGDQKAKVNYSLGSQADPVTKKAQVNYTLNMKKDQKSKSFKVTISAFKGLNNIIKSSTAGLGGIVQANSMAKGGRLGPKDNGGLTLTGEKGFEVAWLPSQGKAMILGTQGPQMTNLPKDAVVWNHEQSKKIVKQKSVPLGSAYDLEGGIKWKDVHTTRQGKTTITTTTSGKKTTGKGNDDKNTTKEKQKQVKEFKKYAKISTYVYNMTKKIEQVERKIEALQKKMNKLLEKTTITLNGIDKTGNKEIRRLKQEVSLNRQLEKYYKKKLRRLNSNGKKSRTLITWENPTKERTKSDGKWSKWSEGTKKHKAHINLGKYIKYDPSTGAYLLDEKQLDKVSRKYGKNKAKAIRDKAKEKLDEYVQGRDNAKDKITDAKDKLSELAKQIYDTFWGWENELTKVLHITTQLAEIEGKRESLKSLNSLFDAQLQSGMETAGKTFRQEYFKFFKLQTQTSIQAIKKREEEILAKREELNNYISSDGSAEIKELNKKINNSKKAYKAKAKYEKVRKKVDKYENNQNRAKKAYEDIQKQKNRIKKAKTDKLSKKEKKDLKKDLLSKKEREKLEKKVKQGKASKSEKKKLKADKRARRLLNRDKHARQTIKDAKRRIKQDKKIRAYNSSKALTRANRNKIKKDRVQARKAKQKAKQDLQDNKKNLISKKKFEKLQQKATTKKGKINLKKLSKTERKQYRQYLKYQDAKKRLKQAKARITKDNKFLSAYEAKSNRARLKAQSKKLKKYRLSSTKALAYEEYKEQLKQRRKNLKRARQYVKTTKLADGTVQTTLDYKKLEKDRKAGKISENLYNFIKDYYDKINESNNELNSLYQEQLGQLEELYSTVRELKDRYAEHSEELLSALEDEAQAEIDKLEKMSNAISNALKDLLDEVKKRLDQRRQEEENAKTEKDIMNKQQRLAALRADNAGGNAKEIAALEKEIADAQKDYQRSLEDQALEKLQDQADEAEKQREKQIQLLQTQLEVNKANGYFFALITSLLSDPEKNNSRIQELWRRNQDYYNQTYERRKVLDADWQTFKNEINKDTGLRAQWKVVEKQIVKVQSILKDIKSVLELSALKAAGKSAKDVKAMGYSAREARNAGYSTKSVIDAYGLGKQKSKAARRQSFKDAGITASALRKAGYSIAQLKKWGFSDKEILKAGYSTKDLLKAGYSGKQIQQATGRSNVGRVINSNLGTKGDNISVRDRGGVEDKFKANGKKITGTYTSSGKYIVGNRGSTLYTQNVGTGRTTSLNVKDFKPSEVKKWSSAKKKEGKQAFIYAIKHTTPGDLINKNMGKLVELFGIKNKTYKLKNNFTATIGPSGKIYWGYGKTGVKIWNPSKKNSLSLDKWDKKKFINRAKNYKKGIGREYAEVLKARGITKYARGGLATTTGPAWLDGTKSQPELVLNAKDTANFIALKNVLSHAVSGMGTVNNSDMSNYEINVNVDKISNDYDVDKMVARIKKQIVNDANYRNVNAVRNMR